MSYQHFSHWTVCNSNTSVHDDKYVHHEALSVDEAPNMVWMPVLMPVQAFHPYWAYPAASHDHGAYGQVTTSPSQSAPADEGLAVEERQQHAQPAPASCNAAGDDALSDASTDVGEGDDMADDFEEDMAEDLNAPTKAFKKVDATPMPQRPSLFATLSRQQRVDQLKRVVDEFCTSDFDSVDSTSQGGLVCRMLTTLKSLKETATFHGENGQTREKRFSLLGLDQDDEDAITDVVNRAQDLCEERCFRKAFAVLKEGAPRLTGTLMPATTERHDINTEASEAPEEVAPQPRHETPAHCEMIPEEIEAMKQRRLEKRQRQRGERRVQRAADRADRAALRHQNVSPSVSASAGISGMSTNWSKKSH
jgi:hypothetical protein